MFGLANILKGHSKYRASSKDENRIRELFWQGMPFFSKFALYTGSYAFISFFIFVMPFTKFLRDSYSQNLNSYIFYLVAIIMAIVAIFSISDIKKVSNEYKQKRPLYLLGMVVFTYCVAFVISLEFVLISKFFFGLF